MTYEDKILKVNDALHHLELDVEGSVAFIEFKLLKDELFLIHTEVPHELEGKGAGNAIVVKALQYAKDNHYKIIPICPFVKRFLERHKEWNELVATDADRFMHKP